MRLKFKDLRCCLESRKLALFGLELCGLAGSRFTLVKGVKYLQMNMDHEPFLGIDGTDHLL